MDILHHTVNRNLKKQSVLRNVLLEVSNRSLEVEVHLGRWDKAHLALVLPDLLCLPCPPSSLFCQGVPVNRYPLARNGENILTVKIFSQIKPGPSETNNLSHEHNLCSYKVCLAVCLCVCVFFFKSIRKLQFSHKWI